MTSANELWTVAKWIDMVDLAHGLGALLKQSGHHWIGPCPLGCASTDGFVVTPSKRLFYCRPSGAGGDALDMVMHVKNVSPSEALEYITGQRTARKNDAYPQKPRRETTSPAPTPPSAAGPARKEAGQSAGWTTTTEDALALWRPAVDPRRTLVERYFNIERNLNLSADLAGEVLRWHPGVGAMLALFRNIETGAPQAVSRTFLDRDA
jgi:hypothetical protein